MNPKILNILLAAGLLSTLTGGCAQAVKEETPAAVIEETATPDGNETIDYTTGVPWLCSFLDGNVTNDTPTPDLKDDFYLAMNKDALANMKIPDGYSRYGTQPEVAMQADEDIKALFTSAEKAESHDAILALNLYSLYSDWDSRNAAGIAPLKEMSDAVEAIDSIDALNTYLSETPGEDRLYDLYEVTYMADSDNTDRFILTLTASGLLLEDAAEYKDLTSYGEIKKNASIDLVMNMLQKLGYTEEEAKKKIDNCLAFETELSSSMYTDADSRKPDYRKNINNHYSREDFIAASGNLPLIDTFEKAQGYPVAEDYLVFEPKWLDQLNTLYTEEHLEEIRDYLIVHGVIKKADLLDRECFDWKTEYTNAINGITGTLSDEIVFSQAVKEELQWPVARLYCETYLSQADKDRISSLIDNIIEEYHGIINEADFLSDATKTAAIEKLEAINKQVLWPDDWTSYECTGLEIPSAEEGGTLWQAIQSTERFMDQKAVEEYSKPVDKNRWEMVPTMFNAGYDPNMNSILILGAFARGALYNSEMSDEELYSRIGMVIGHEISHAFDSAGAQFDKNGNISQWWSDEDWQAFNERNDKLIAYYDRIHPWQGQDYIADIKSGEACADMGGMKCMLRLAAKKEDFDYDRFFRSYADLWLYKGTLNQTYKYINDEHPMPYLRVNCVLQQYPEFLDFYGIKEGDGMYLSPEERVAIW